MGNFSFFQAINVTSITNPKIFARKSKMFFTELYKMDAKPEPVTIFFVVFLDTKATEEIADNFHLFVVKSKKSVIVLDQA